MTYYDVIGLLNTSMSALFCVCMIVIWRNNRQLSYILIFCLSYAARSVSFGVFYFAFSLENAVLRFLANVCLMAAMLLLSIGLSGRRARRPRYGMLLTIAATVLWALYYKQFVEHNLVERVFYFNFGVVAVSIFMMLDSAKGSYRTPVEQVLFGLIIVSCVGFILRPIFLLASGIPDGGFEGAYWLVVSISDALICAMTAVGIFAVIASDVMDNIKSDAQIDILSGLFNRRGFEPRALDALARRAAGARVAMIVSDLDHFKSINDCFGHISGDRIIRAFADILRVTAPRDSIMGRLGGEEFAILLPPGRAGAAYLWADEVRSAFKEAAPGILSGEARPTASFGIAFACEGEDLQALMDRADRALYRAKSDGRDCVRLIE